MDDDGCRWRAPSLPTHHGGTSSRCSRVIIPGPLYVDPLKVNVSHGAGRNAAAAAKHVECLRTKPGLFGDILRDSPIVVFVRDPVARFTACFNFMLLRCTQPDSSTTGCRQVANYVATASAVVRGAAADGQSAALEWSNATDLQFILEHLLWRTRQEGSVHTATSLFSAIKHAATGVAWYFGGLSGLAQLERRLLFVGTVEAISDDFAALQRIIARHFGLSAFLPSMHVELGHTHSSTTGRARRRLPAQLVTFVRDIFIEDYDSISWLSQRGFVHYGGRGGAQYVESITYAAANNAYWFEPPLSEQDCSSDIKQAV